MVAGTSPWTCWGRREGCWYTHDTDVSVPALGPVGCDTGRDPKSGGRVGPEGASVVGASVVRGETERGGTEGWGGGAGPDAKCASTCAAACCAACCARSCRL